MKKFFYLAAALTVLAGAASCDKNIDDSQPQPYEKCRQVTITAGSAQTKTSVSGGALTWSENDKLNIVPQSGTVAAAALDITSGVGQSTGSFQGLIDASIKDNTDLYGWCGGSWTYTSGSFSVDMPATQTYVENGLAENAYPSIGTGSITSGITLSNPMGVLKLSVKGATSNDKVKSITVTSAANNLAGSFSVDKSTYAVSGGSSKTVTLNVASPYTALSITDAENFYIILPPAEYSANDLTVKITFSDDSYLNTTFADVVTVTASEATAKEISDHTGRCGILNNQEYVLIKAKYNGNDSTYLKWATQNLAVTESGKAKWKSTNYQIGDYFQWAASYAGYNIPTASQIPDSLVIYTSFTIDGSNNPITSRDGMQFKKTFAPYGGSSFTKYTSGSATLDLTDDVARIVLGSTWRMPTGGSAGEFKAMKESTYWAWDGTDNGYYVFKPGVGTSGTAGGSGTYGTGDDRTKALLFFPAVGLGNTNNNSEKISSVGMGFYWSSTLYSENTDYAYYLYFKQPTIKPDNNRIRYYGFSVRPVSN